MRRRIASLSLKERARVETSEKLLFLSQQLRESVVGFIFAAANSLTFG